MISCKNSYSQSGCYIDGDNVIYTNPTGATAGYPWYFPVLGPYPVYNTSLSTSAPACPRASLLPGNGAYCLVGNERGRIRSYQYLTPPTLCPIDDYIPFIFFSIGGLGFFYLRRNNSLI